MQDWTATDLAYFAGLLDGEGSFMLHRQGQSFRFSCQVNMGNTDIRLVEWVKTRFGGNISLEKRNNPKHRPVWRWYADAKTLDTLLQAIMPYLVGKRAQAEILLSYRRTLTPPISGHRSSEVLSSETKQIREDLRGQLLRLHRGVS